MLDSDRLVKRWLLPVLGSALALTVVLYLYRGLDYSLFLGSLESANLWWIAVLMAAILTEQIVNGWKWRQLLFDIKPISTSRLSGALLAGYGANTLAPLGISPLVRSWLVARLEGLGMATVLATTIIARFIDGVVFALIAGLVTVFGALQQIEGGMRWGLAVAGLLNLVLFGGLLLALFRYRRIFERDNAILCRAVDWIARLVRRDGRLIRKTFGDGIILPNSATRRIAVIGASVIMKIIGASHFLWAGLAVGVLLQLSDYFFLLVFAGFSLVLARFVRIPGGFVIGSAYALSLLGVADEPALVMVLAVHLATIFMVVGLGLVILWRSGIDIHALRQEARE